MARGKLTISLSAVVQNYQFLCAKTMPSRCAAVVKANAYGLGITAIAPALAGAGTTDFFVALPEEGATLRAILPQAKIYVLNGFLPDETGLMLQYSLTPVLNDPGALEIWRSVAHRTAMSLPAVVHVDTGLNRLGFNSDDFISHAPKMADMHIPYIMSHLACADTPSNPLNALQLRRLNEAHRYLPTARRSLAASDGIFCGADFHGDMVRPGAALYGLNPTPAAANPMKPVVQLAVPILQIRNVEQDGTVGYAASQAVTKGQRLATAALGYADGFMRSLSNRATLFYQGKALPVLGRVSMDVVVVDIAAAPDLVVGDFLDVFGFSQTPDDLAKVADTIGYELLTMLGARFERVYITD